MTDAQGPTGQDASGAGAGVPPIPGSGSAEAPPPASPALAAGAPAMGTPPADAPPPGREPAHVRLLRMPSAKAGAVLAAIMLGIGIAAGAALAPGPADSSALGSLAARLPLLLGLGRSQSQAPAAQAEGSPSPAAAPAAKAGKTAPQASSAATETAPGSSTSGSGETSEGSEGSSSGGGSKKRRLPAITTVWLIQLDGPGFSQTLEKASAAPYLTGTAISQGTLLKGWSATAAGAFAYQAAIAETPPPGSAPPLVHSLVEPPCPEGAAGASCTAETPGQLTAADNYLKETLATITGTPAYKEHGLVVITFASVGLATQQGLPAGSSSATLTTQPPAGALLLSPFAAKGAKPSTAFNTTSPRQSLEALLH